MLTWGDPRPAAPTPPTASAADLASAASYAARTDQPYFVCPSQIDPAFVHFSAVWPDIAAIMVDVAAIVLPDGRAFVERPEVETEEWGALDPAIHADEAADRGEPVVLIGPREGYWPTGMTGTLANGWSLLRRQDRALIVGIILPDGRVLRPEPAK